MAPKDNPGDTVAASVFSPPDTALLRRADSIKAAADTVDSVEPLPKVDKQARTSKRARRHSRMRPRPSVHEAQPAAETPQAEP